MAEIFGAALRATQVASASASSDTDAEAIEIEVTALDAEIQQAMQSGKLNFEREFKDLLDVLRSLVSEIQLDHPNSQALESLGMSARQRWQKVAKMVIGTKLDGTPRASQFEMNLVTQSKGTMDSILISATLADPRNKGAHEGVVDKPDHSSDDQSMTDMTRQQVTDLLAASEAKMDARLANFDTSIKTGFADLRTEFAQVRAEMANDRTASSKQNSDSQRWIVTAVAAMISIAVALIGVMINYNKGDKPAAVPPAPIVIYAQPAATAPPAVTVPAKP